MADGRRSAGPPREKPHRIADELRALIASGELSEGDSLGREPELIERFGVSRPSLREALKILEADGLITIMRGVRGGVVVHEPHERIAARSTALLLQANGVPLADVFEASALLEPLAAKELAEMRDRRQALDALRSLIAAQQECLKDPERFRLANAVFHERLVALVGNQTLAVVAEILTVLVSAAVAALRQPDHSADGLTKRRRSIRSQERLIALIEEGDGEAAAKHWRTHMHVVKRERLGDQAPAVVDLSHYFPALGKPQQVADEIRVMIVSGELAEGASLGHEPELVERFGVSRPSLREALRLLEADGLITVVRGAYGRIIAHLPDRRTTARSGSLLLRSRNVPLADVYEARSLLEPLAVREIAAKRNRRTAISELRVMVEREEAAIKDPECFAVANASFHERLVSLGGNETLAIVIEMLNEIVVRSVATVSAVGDATGSVSTRRRGLRSQRLLLDLLDAGDAAAEEHWRAHMGVVRRIMLGQEASRVVDLLLSDS